MASIKRQEDPRRFITAVSSTSMDVVLAGMLWPNLLRSPVTRDAKILKIDTSAWTSTQGKGGPATWLAVITWKDLREENCTGCRRDVDTQMVMPVDKVMYQAQEVAAVLGPTSPLRRRRRRRRASRSSTTRCRWSSTR